MLRLAKGQTVMFVLLLMTLLIVGVQSNFPFYLVITIPEGKAISQTYATIHFTLQAYEPSKAYLTDYIEFAYNVICPSGFASGTIDFSDYQNPYDTLLSLSAWIPSGMNPEICEFGLAAVDSALSNVTSFLGAPVQTARFYDPVISLPKI